MLLKRIYSHGQPYLAFSFALLFAINFVMLQTLHHHDLVKDAKTNCEYCLLRSLNADLPEIVNLPTVYFVLVSISTETTSNLVYKSVEAPKLRGPPIV